MKPIVWLIICVSLLVIGNLTTFLRAKKRGIIRVKCPIFNGWFVCYMIIAASCLANVCLSISNEERESKYLYGLQTRGVPYYEKVNDTHQEFYFPGDEERFLDSEIARSAERLDYHQKYTVISAIAAAAFALTGVFNGAYITKEGIFLFAASKLIKTAAKTDGGKLRFYSADKPERTLLKLPANEENLRLYSEFIVGDNARPQQI